MILNKLRLNQSPFFNFISDFIINVITDNIQLKAIQRRNNNKNNNNNHNYR